MWPARRSALSAPWHLKLTQVRSTPGLSASRSISARSTPGAAKPVHDTRSRCVMSRRSSSRSTAAAKARSAARACRRACARRCRRNAPRQSPASSSWPARPGARTEYRRSMPQRWTMRSNRRRSRDLKQTGRRAQTGRAPRWPGSRSRLRSEKRQRRCSCIVDQASETGTALWRLFTVATAVPWIATIWCSMNGSFRESFPRMREEPRPISRAILRSRALRGTCRCAWRYLARACADRRKRDITDLAASS